MKTIFRPLLVPVCVMTMALAPDNAAAQDVILPAPDSTLVELVMPIRESVGMITDPILPSYDLSGADALFPEWFFLPAVYDHFSFADQEPVFEAVDEGFMAQEN
ncbi:MAG: hypothetical protein K2M05_08535, partial [Paramuribaculum sp.]|nr:hypothetical protein [Paramuribaculum sp.]